MTWHVPAKTFLVGEYIALSSKPAILLTTTPCFVLSKVPNAAPANPFHPDSPAGLFYAKTQVLHDFAFEWFCPYHHQGGLGGSSAEFVALYRAYASLSQQEVSIDAMLAAYLSCQARDARLPSGYDVMAQALGGCVYIDNTQQRRQRLTWPNSLSFILIHTGKKLATHTHLQTNTQAWPEDTLCQIVQQVYTALSSNNIAIVAQGVNAYYDALLNAGLVAAHIPPLREVCMAMPGVMAAKGCGAMGADILLLLVEPEKTAAVIEKIKQQDLAIIATDEHIFN